MEAVADKLSADNRRLVSELCRAYRVWAPDEPAPPTAAAVLAGGQRNTVVRLQGARGAWVLRIAPPPTPSGVCRQRELQIQRAAARARIAPVVAHADPERGVLISTYLTHSDRADRSPGIPATGRQAHAADGEQELAELAGLLRAIHALPPVPPAVSSAAHLERARAAVPVGHALRTELAQTQALFARARDHLGHTAGGAVLCHNDLLQANRIRHRGALMAIDWEYASCGDRFFDLAVCASELDEGQHHALLTHYLQRPPAAAEMQRFRHQQLLYAAIAACWYAAFADGSHGYGRAHRSLQHAIERRQVHP